ncbi:MAG: chemotaxis protein methyltransferase CheR, partial [Acidobacteriota bacterium]|nr:chemotaxis protein methyltransferase CheR [Acidobacteriota bacterium]
YDLPEGELDLILLRNVLIYFKRPLQRWVVEQVAERLAPHGYLFLGASETLWQIQDELDSVDLGGSFCYRHPTEARPARAVLLERPKPAVREKPKPAAPRSLAPAKRKPATPLVRPAPIAPIPLVPADRLAAAALLLADNRIAEAGSAVADLLAADPSEPANHALLGFLHDLSGRPEEAVTAYRAALYLDPALYQARLLLADCLLRLGHRDLAEKQFKEVLTLVASGRERALEGLAALPLPDRERAMKRCRQALQGG